MWGLILLGVTSVYREGFEVVLFLQNLRLSYGAGTVLEGVVLGLALTALVGGVTFFAHRHLPYKRMLVLTGVMLGVVLIVMVGESIQEMQLAGWLPETTVALSIPGWVGLWFAVFPTVEGLVAQALAAALVLGSYFGAEYWRVKRPRSARARRARCRRRGRRRRPVLDPDAPRIGRRAARSAIHQGRDDRFVEAVAVGLLGDRDVAERGQVGAQAGVALRARWRRRRSGRPRRRPRGPRPSRRPRCSPRGAKPRARAWAATAAALETVRGTRW